MTHLTDDQVRALLDEVANNPPRVCVAWCGKAKEDCACYKAGVAVGALNDAAPDLARALLQARADAAAAQALVVERAADAVQRHYGCLMGAPPALLSTIRALAPDAGTAELAKLRTIAASEKELSDAYLRIRAKLGAWNTKPGGADRFEVTEAALDTLAAENAALRQALITWRNTMEGGSLEGLCVAYEIGNAALGVPAELRTSADVLRRIWRSDNV